jgi:hypothetical protein
MALRCRVLRSILKSLLQMNSHYNQGSHHKRSTVPMRPLKSSATRIALVLIHGAAASAYAQSTPGTVGAAGHTGWQFGAVLDAAHLSNTVPLGLRDKGLGLGHSDLLARGTLGRHFSAEGIAAVSTHEGHLEKGVEKLFIQTRTLPAGFQVRMGRFASQVGYLNEQHPHADDFVERPALYRAFLGHHYFDDGLRLNWTAPTPFLLQFGAESFSGKKLNPDSTLRSRSGVDTITVKVGSDIGTNQAWQAGLSLLRNRRAAFAEDRHDASAMDHAVEHLHGEHEESHGHGVAFSGRRLSIFDLAWKWAPNGNPREQQIRLVLEHARLSGVPHPAQAQYRHGGSSLALVWRFRPDWEAGIRADRLRAAYAHEDHADPAHLNEHSAMLVYKPSHRQALRLQWTTNRNAQGFDMSARRVVALQYVVAFGAHGAHPF